MSARSTLGQARDTLLVPLHMTVIFWLIAYMCVGLLFSANVTLKRSDHKYTHIYKSVYLLEAI